jgi:hypothetical protein
VTLAEHIPDRAAAANLLDAVARALPKARFFIPCAPADTYGLTPLHFAPRPGSLCSALFTREQIDGRLDDLLKRQREDGSWPISWEAPSPSAVMEWRGKFTLDAICRLSA